MIRKFLDLSTSHVSPDARDWLDLNGALEADRDGAGGAHNVALTRHGWFMWIPEREDGGNLHPDLKPVAEHARAAGCDYVLFDGDALEIEQLPVYEWEDGQPANTATPWRGGAMPVKAGTLVNVMLRYGKMKVAEAGTGYATRWEHIGAPDDIVAYHVLDDVKTYLYTAEDCPSKHHNGGDDVCTDCGKFLG